LREEPKLIDAAVEETLRYDAPVQFLMRKATKPMHYYGQDVAVGENVTVVMAAANRDPDVYENPDEFRLDRAKNHHHTFGFGPHFCMGAPLARMEARLVMRELLTRFSAIQRPQSPPAANERVASPLLRGFHHLWIELLEPNPTD
ncbi:MAG: cytochrome P450, partial [Pseudomonadota bacterium]